MNITYYSSIGSYDHIKFRKIPKIAYPVRPIMNYNIK